MDADTQLDLELEVCELYGVRHSEFLSWSADDRDKALWRRIRARQTCPTCGTRHAEWDERVGGDRHAYHGEKYRCRGCEVLEEVRSSITSEDGKGVYPVLKPREVSGGQS